MTHKEQELQQLLSRIQILRTEIEKEKQQARISKLRPTTSVGVFRSKFGVPWYKFPARSDPDTFAKHFFLTDLKGNYIPDQLQYEGHVCKPGWAVKAYYCTTEQQAIDMFEELNDS